MLLFHSFLLWFHEVDIEINEFSDGGTEEEIVVYDSCGLSAWAIVHLSMLFLKKYRIQ